MPRSRGGGGGRRPSAAPARSSAPAQPPQTRQMTTTARPPMQAQQQQQQRPAGAQGSQGPGLFGQMASTAAGVAVGSSIGHAIGGFFGGGATSAPVEAQQANTAAMGDGFNSTSQNSGAGPCANDIQSFRSCMDQNQGSLSICGWYLDQLKACQQAASQY